MSDKPDGGPAFPLQDPGVGLYQRGMSLRQYAAIHLRMPDSGTPWLDGMIHQSLRQDFALGGGSEERQAYTLRKTVEFTDSLLAELEKKGGG